MKWEFDTEEVLVSCAPVSYCQYPIPALDTMTQERDCGRPAVSVITWEGQHHTTEMPVCRKHEDKIREDYEELTDE